VTDFGFRGEIADLYHRFRRGYPPSVIEELVAAFGLMQDDLVVDLGCGTGQLTIPLARRVRAALGVDPEGDMLARARTAAAEAGVSDIGWLLGSDADVVPTLRALVGDGGVAAVCIGQALHWMDHERLFAQLRPLLRSGGGIAVVTNGVPLWLQDSAWSRALRSFLTEWLGAPVGRTCGTDAASQASYEAALAAAGFDVTTRRVEYAEELDLEQLTGGVYSALPVDRLPPPSRREAFAERLAAALEDHGPFVEHVPVTVLIGR
jgi:trans-aconitate methyltransferase